MPIIVTDFTWNQNEQYVVVHIPLHGVPTSAVDVFTHVEYFKVSFESFFFECFPYECVNPDESRGTILETEVVLELKKTTETEWPLLEKTLTKPEKKEIKTKALLETQKKLTEEHNKKRQAFYQEKRDAIGMVVESDTQKRNKIAAIKEQEKLKALGDIEELRIDTKPTQHKKSKVIRNHYQKVYNYNADNKDETAMPMPRSVQANPSVVEVDFTPRMLPTPCRESQEAQETEWLTKQAQARRSAGFVSEDLRPEEKNPDFILFKGEGFLKHKNYLGAISAFTFGIEIAPKLVDFYIMRSRAHFEIGNHHKCLLDCSTAIDMMKPEVYANLSQRVECIHRRGMALFKLGLKREAADEVKAAIKLQPSRELTKDLYEILDSPEYIEKPQQTLGLQEIEP